MEQFADLTVWLTKKERVVFLKGFDTPVHTMLSMSTFQVNSREVFTGFALINFIHRMLIKPGEDFHVFFHFGHSEIERIVLLMVGITSI